MRPTKKFFTPLCKVLLFILATIGGAQILYSEVIFPGYDFLPYEIYNPILDMTIGRFLFRIIVFIWAFLLYLFLQFILRRKKWKDLVIANEKNKFISFFKGSLIGIIYISIVLITLITFRVYQLNEFLFLFKTKIITLILQFIAVIATAFFLELIFRVTVLNHLKKFLNFHVANLITSVIFASIFVFSSSDYYPIRQFSFSLLLGYMYFIYGFYLVFGFHFGWNFIESIFFSDTIFTINLVRQSEFTPLREEYLISFIVLSLGLFWFLAKFIKQSYKRKKN